MNIDNELLAAYAEGNVSAEEREAVRQYLAANPDKMESVLFAMGIDNVYEKNLGTMLDDIEKDLTRTSSISSQHSILPMTAMAAQNTVDNQCVIRCECLAIQHFGMEVTEQELLIESEQAGWLKPEGTALHNIGQLSGKRGLSVSHRYHCNVQDIQNALDEGSIVIAVIDSYELSTDAEHYRVNKIGVNPNHAVIIDDIKDGKITITDSATSNSKDIYTLPLFLQAWNDSTYYLIVISNGGEYIPHPICVSDVEVEDELKELQEAIAENAHEVWAETRKKEGWTFGPERDDQKKQHPDMLPYNLLLESEKEYDRQMAMNTIKLVKKLGWELKKVKNTSSKNYIQQQHSPVKFSDTECRAIVTLCAKMMRIDHKFSADELSVRRELFSELGVTSEHEKYPLTYNQAIAIVKAMPKTKRNIILHALNKLAFADGIFVKEEQEYLEDVIKKIEN